MKIIIRPSAIKAAADLPLLRRATLPKRYNAYDKENSPVMRGAYLWIILFEI